MTQIVVSTKEAISIFQSVETLAKSLNKDTPSELPTICQNIALKVHALITYAEQKKAALRQQSKQAALDLISAERALSNLEKKQRTQKAQLQSLQVQWKGLQERKAALEELEASSSQNTKNLKRAIKKKKKKRLGFILGVVTIPAAIMAHQEKKQLTKKLGQEHASLSELQEEMHSVSGEIAKQENAIQQYEDQIHTLKQRKTEKNQTIKHLGRKVTALENVGIQLNALLRKYQLLQEDTKNIEKFLHSTIVTPLMIRNLRHDLSATKASFSAIESV